MGFLKIAYAVLLLGVLDRTKGAFWSNMFGGGGGFNGNFLGGVNNLYPGHIGSNIASGVYNAMTQQQLAMQQQLEQTNQWMAGQMPDFSAQPMYPPAIGVGSNFMNTGFGGMPMGGSGGVYQAVVPTPNMYGFGQPLSLQMAFPPWKHNRNLVKKDSDKKDPDKKDSDKKDSVKNVTNQKKEQKEKKKETGKKKKKKEKKKNKSKS